MISTETEKWMRRQHKWKMARHIAFGVSMILIPAICIDPRFALFLVGLMLGAMGVVSILHGIFHWSDKG